MLGTNVDYAPTWLAMAGIAAPHTYDGRSILSQGCKKEQVRQCLGFVQLMHRQTRTKNQLYKKLKHCLT